MGRARAPQPPRLSTSHAVTQTLRRKAATCSSATCPPSHGRAVARTTKKTRQRPLITSQVRLVRKRVKSMRSPRYVGPRKSGALYVRAALSSLPSSCTSWNSIPRQRTSRLSGRKKRMTLSELSMHASQLWSRTTRLVSSRLRCASTRTGFQ